MCLQNIVHEVLDHPVDLPRSDGATGEPNKPKRSHFRWAHFLPDSFHHFWIPDTNTYVRFLFKMKRYPRISAFPRVSSSGIASQQICQSAQFKHLRTEQRWDGGNAPNLPESNRPKSPFTAPLLLFHSPSTLPYLVPFRLPIVRHTQFRPFES